MRLTRRTPARAEGVSRRTFLAATAAAVAAPAILRNTRAYAANPVIKIGFVTPTTGPLAGFAEADDFVIGQAEKIFAGGLQNHGKSYGVQILKRDSQSNPNRAAEVASELILRDKVDILLAAATPDTTNPAADQAEVNGVPCITTNCPWQPYFFGRNGKPDQGFEWTYHFFWGLEDVIASYLAIWNESGVGKNVACLFPNDADGNAWGDQKLGFPPALTKAGYKFTDTGRYQDLLDDFTAQISAFKQAGCDIVTGCMIPPDAATFWNQAAQQGFRPKIVTIGKALLFPSALEALGQRGDGLSTEVWWTPNHPFTSSLTGRSAKQLADDYTAATKKPWTQPIGFQHAMFEIVADVVKRAADLDHPEAILDAIKTTNIKSIVGPINWTANNPVKNVSKTPLVAGQWLRGKNGFELVIVENKTAPDIPVGGKLKLLA